MATSQVAPVLAELSSRLPGLRLTLQGNLAPGLIKSHLPAGMRHLTSAAEPGLVMDGPLMTRWDASLAVYQRFVAEQDLHMARQRAILAATAPDLLLADVPGYR